MNVVGLFQEFRSKRIAIVGDVMLDVYFMGKVHRMSPEAPVPILQLTTEEHRLGGAANVALNLKALGAQVHLCSVIGDDVPGRQLHDLLLTEGIECSALHKAGVRKTTVKTRVLSGPKHLLRIDHEDVAPIDEWMAEKLIASLKLLIGEGIDAIIFQDYNKGVLTDLVITESVKLAKANGVLVCVDPKKDQFLSYQEVDLFKPNLKELREGLEMELNPRDINTLLVASSKLRDQLKHKISLITLSEFGVFVDDGTFNTILPAHFRDISDVCGAGDTVIAVATLALCSGLNLQQIAALANLAGGMVCEHSGVVSVNGEELLEEAKKLQHFNE